MNILYILLAIFGTHYGFLIVYKALLLANKELGTNRFKEHIYPKFSLKKRFFMRIHFEESVIDKCVNKTQIEKLLIPDIIYSIVGAILILIQIILYGLNDDLDIFNIIVYVYVGIFVVFFLGLTVKGTDWKKWLKGEWKRGQLELKVELKEDSEKQKAKWESKHRKGKSE